MLPSRMPSKKANNKEGQYSLQNKFGGYNARSDKTLLTPNIMVAPSQNVLVGTSGRIASVDGYTLDGGASATIDSGILSNFDFKTSATGSVRNLRAGFLTSAGNDGKLQYRYEDSSNTVSWINLLTGLTTVRFSFTEYFDTSVSEGGTGELKKLCLFVDGSNNLYEWNGGVTTFSSATATTLTKQSTRTWAQDGFNFTAYTTVGGGTTQFDITNTSGTTYRYTYDTTGTDPSISSATFPIGSYVLISAQNFNTANNGLFIITGVGSNYFEVTNSSGVVESNKTIGTGYIYKQYKKVILVNGVAIAYTGGESTTTLTGLTSDLSATTVGTVITQAVITTACSAITALPATFGPTCIGCGRKNQVYLGSSSSNVLYISKQNNYLSYAFNTPVRVVGEGAQIVLNDPPTKFIPQEVHANDTAYDMYISEGRDQWCVIRSTLSSDNTSELLEHIVLKVSPLQGSRSERHACKMKNHIMFLGYDNVAGFLGYMSYEYVPVITDFSFQIIDDMNSYDHTDGSMFYYRNYAYLAVPREGLIRVYNMTDQSNEQYSAYQPIEQLNNQQPFFWEAPIKYPISGFYITQDGSLGGHGYNTSESYILFTGDSFNGQNIEANATFAYDDKGDRTQSKGSTEVWVEGYIKQNTDLSVTVTGDLDSFANSQTKIINGNDSAIVAYGSGGGALGKNPLGSNPLGGTQTSTLTLPSWFHVSKTYPQVPFYLEQISFDTNGIGLKWELLTFGTNAEFTPEGNNSITQ